MEETSIVNDARAAATPESEMGPVEARIEKWVYGGEGLARIPTPEGSRAVLVPFTLPAETVRIDAGDGIHAGLTELVTPSPDRVQPPCPLFTNCGGCHYQHAPYSFQLQAKADILREQLRRVGKIEYKGEIETISGAPLGYRNRVQLHIENGRLGYLRPRSHRLVALDGECPVASPRLNQAIAQMRERLQDRQFPRFVKSFELFTNETDVQVNVLETDKPVAKRFFEWCESAQEMDYETSVGTFRVSPRSFFQVNRFLIEQLVDAALGDARGESALDLYAGVGLFALPMTERFGNIIAVEAGASAARDLSFNATRIEDKLENVNFEIAQSRVDDFLSRYIKSGATPDFVLADPPRAGLGKSVTTSLTRLSPARLAIVSCDPATLARDLAALSGYSIEKMILVDLFPQTYHLETIVHLKRA
ncbi:MAG: class I SAM-dependent RNA methyltransferase [Bryobacteraceae bacterium]